MSQIFANYLAVEVANLLLLALDLSPLFSGFLGVFDVRRSELCELNLKRCALGLYFGKLVLQ